MDLLRFTATGNLEKRKSSVKGHCHRGLEADALTGGVASTRAGASDAPPAVVAGVSVVVEASAVAVAAVAGIWDVGLELCTPEAGLDPKALLNLALALFIVVRSPTFEAPWSTFSLVVWFSLLNLLKASMRSLGVAWRIRPTLRVLRIRERRLRRAAS